MTFGSSIGDHGDVAGDDVAGNDVAGNDVAGNDAGPTGRTEVNRWRQQLTLLLGGVWLLDAALQYQPFMFTKDFPNQVIKPTGQGSPGWVSGPVTWSADLLAGHIVFWNAVFATAQLAIAVGLLWRRTAKPALAASIVWALMVWWLGEGLGGILAGPVSPIMGLPGAVLIYALIAALLWPRTTPAEGSDPTRVGSVAQAGPIGSFGAKLIWVVFWALFVFEALRPANRAHGALHDMVSGMAAGEPAWVKSIDTFGSHLVSQRGLEFSVALAAIFALVGLSVFLPVADVGPFC